MSQIRPDRLFARWFGIVYLPLGLLGVVLLAVATGVLARPPLPLIAAGTAYGAVAVRLLYERRRRGLVVKAPSALVGGLAWVCGVGLTGAVMLWIGLERLHSYAGTIFSLLGAFLILVALLAPLLRAIDFALRKGGGFIRRSVAPGSTRVDSGRLTQSPYLDEEDSATDFPSRSEEALPYAAGSSQGGRPS